MPGVHLFPRLDRVAAVDEDGGAVREHDGGACRAGEARQPSQPFRARRHVFVLVLVGPGHDEPVQAAPLQFGAQCGQARPGAGRVRCFHKGLKAGFEAAGHAREPRAPCRNSNLPADYAALQHPISAMRRASS